MIKSEAVQRCFFTLMHSQNLFRFTNVVTMETMTRILAKEFQQNYINRQESKKVLNIVFLKSQY